MLSKGFIASLLLIALLYSCHTKEKAVTANTTTSQEQLLIDSVNKYPDSLPLRENLIQFYSDSGYYKKAIAAADQAIAKDTSNVQLLDIKAQLYYQDGDTLSAIKMYEKALTIFPVPDYLMSLGNLYAQARNPKALAMADEVLKRTDTKSLVEGNFIKGLYYEFTGNKPMAITYFDKCTGLDYTYMYGYREKAICLYDMKRFKDALAVLERAITIENSYDEGYYWMGKCLEKLSRDSEAAESYQRAIMYDKDYIEAREALERLQKK